MVIVIIAAIALIAFYFAAPDSFRNTFPFFFDDGAPSGDTSAPPLARGEGELQVHFTPPLLSPAAKANCKCIS